MYVAVVEGGREGVVDRRKCEPAKTQKILHCNASRAEPGEKSAVAQARLPASKATSHDCTTASLDDGGRGFEITVSH